MAHDTVPYVGAAFDKSGNLRRPENLDNIQWERERKIVDKALKDPNIHSCQLKFFSPNYGDVCLACKKKRD